MYDLHYDLLTYIYYLINKGNISLLKEFCNKTFNIHNINGGIMNFYSLSPKDMENEFDIKISSSNFISIITKVINAIEEYNLLPSNNFIYGIEGCDYLNTPYDLEILYRLGIRSIIPIWKNNNKYGYSIGYDNGLTTLGKDLIRESVKLNMIVDLSHANDYVFSDIINIIHKMKDSGYNPITIASHSNARILTNHHRNLTDNELLKIKELDGIVGIVAFSPFVKINNLSIEASYLEHINYLKNIFGSTDNIGIATDDMTFHPKMNYNGLNIFPLSNVKECINNILIENGYNSNDVNKIMHLNFEQNIYHKLYK